MKVFIVIVTYNGMHWIERCLKSCEGYSVVIVDNSSEDGTVQFVKKRFPNVKLILQSKNLGFGQGNNIGINYALNQGAEYLFLLNQDAYLRLGALEALTNVHLKNNKFGILSPIHLNGEGKELDLNFFRYMHENGDLSFYSDFILNKKPKNIYSIPFVNAAAWLIHKEVFLKVGGFDPIFYHYGEDNNFCQRVLYYGYKIGVVSDSFVLHDRSNKKGSIVERYSKFFYNGIERQLKIKYSNINFKDGISDMGGELANYKNGYLKSILQLRFKMFIHYRTLFKMLKKLKPEIVKSRETNIKEGGHYLNLE